ncbi:ABC transporter ATP-binding protein [Labrenzia sp. PHM005]|uniref:ABC transporter ATP-binding protein n=1 Tax=Labrenzia sp. PHM005 TaxID=2590016 RepID=UPI001140583B|nr:ABC transporter ATP-binding protein [Labrenzia sp. PHM005]QDG76691.1 ABC transporter ATP-binding protein [Labrenzia sp. PHM005]
MTSAASLTVTEASWAPRGTAPILKPVSLHLEAGRVLGVLGPNGAGKSTFLRLLYRFHRPDTGRIEIDGQDIWSLSARAAAQRVAAVLQEQPTDFALTVLEIVELGRTPFHAPLAGRSADDRAIIQEALDRLDLSGLQNRRFGTLSGGERQRVMVARALAQQPGLLILDEPTNHLDIRHQLEVLKLIRHLDMTIVTSLHDLNMASAVCDDILLLDQGVAKAFGPPHTVLSDRAVSAAFRVQAQRQKLTPSNTSHFTYTLSDKELT